MSRVRLLIVSGLLLILGVINFSIYSKERIKHEGEVIYLKLLPQDPRSLMQGDYMSLRFQLAQEIDQTILHPLLITEEASFLQTGKKTPPLREGQRGTVFIVLDEKRIAHLANNHSGSANMLKLRYRVRKNAIWLGTNAFFFTEGQAKQFEKAQYGEFRLDRRSGEAILTGLRGAQLEAL